MFVFNAFATVLAVATVSAGAAMPASSASAGPDAATDRKPVLRIDGVSMPYPIWFRQVLPGKTLTLTIPSGYSVHIGDDTPHKRDSAYSWKVPDRPGVHSLVMRDRRGDTVQSVNIFVLEPARAVRAGRLNGFRTGQYPADPPKGYIRLEKGDLDARLAPGFRVGQFIVKQQLGHWPKYVVLTDSLILRLQTLLDSLRADGVTTAETFFVMSGYRTPFYNTAIGAKSRSRHMWGDASDIYIDVAPRDGVMDDLNEDGRSTKADADWLYDYADRLFRETDVPKGGLGTYRANAVHGPFVHIDGRGRRARWGR